MIEEELENNSEIWKDIPGYEGLYKISNFGRVKSKKTILKPRIRNKYLAVNLCKDAVIKTENIHRLVAKNFIENTNNKPQVDHIDGNKLNNNYLNLRWATAYENSQENENTPTNKSKAVHQISIDGRIINTFKSISEAAKSVGCCSSDISKCCRKIKHRKYMDTNGNIVWTRDSIQQYAVELAGVHDKLLLQWCTGLGKSYAFIRIQEMLNVESTVIVVAEIAHIQNWKDEYIKHGKQYLLEKTKIFCYASLKNNIDISVDLLCLDEGHHAAADVSIACLATIKTKKLVVLTATITSERFDIIRSVFGDIKVFSISLANAISWGIIPQPRIYVIPLELRKYLQTETFTWTRGTKKNRVTIHCKYHERWGYITNKSKYPNLELIVSCTEEEKNIYLCGQIAYYKQQYLDTRKKGFKDKWMLLSIERKRFLGDCKTELVKPFINVLKRNNKRYICFCSSIEQANAIGGDNAIHSRMVDSNAADCIDAFNNKEIDRLYAVNMLQEGQNLVDIDAGIIIQLDAQDKGFVQKSGRALRAKEPILLVFYYKNTRDEEYMKNIVEGIDPEFIQIIESADELVM